MAQTTQLELRVHEESFNDMGGHKQFPDLQPLGSVNIVRPIKTESSISEIFDEMEARIEARRSGEDIPLGALSKVESDLLQMSLKIDVRREYPSATHVFGYNAVKKPGRNEYMVYGDVYGPAE